jgi:hypothetical protein
VRRTKRFSATMNIPNLKSRRKRNNSDRINPSFAELLGELSAMSRAPETTAGQYLRRRYHVPAEIADLIAALAGLGQEAMR